MQRLSITKGHAFILVYSVCSKQSLEELRAIWALIKELKGQEITQIPVMLVGNKCDESAALREVTELEGKAEAASWGVSFMGASFQFIFIRLIFIKCEYNIIAIMTQSKNKRHIVEWQCLLIIYINLFSASANTYTHTLAWHTECSAKENIRVTELFQVSFKNMIVYASKNISKVRSVAAAAVLLLLFVAAAWWTRAC